MKPRLLTVLLSTIVIPLVLVAIAGPPAGVAAQQPPAAETLIFYLHGDDMPGTADGFTMNATPSSAQTLQLDLAYAPRWYSDPRLTGAFAEGASFTLVKPCAIGLSVAPTYSLALTDADGTVEPIGQATQLLRLCLGQERVTIPVQTPVELTDQHLRLTISGAAGLNLSLSLGAGTYLQATNFVAAVTEIDPAAIQLAEDHGLTEDEAQARIDRQDEMGALARDLTVAFPDSYGGMWIDHANGGVAMVGFTRGVPEGDLERLTEGYNLGGYVRAEVVPFAMTYLEQTVDQLAGGLAEANRDAERTLSLGIRPELNRVEIAVPAGVPLTAGQQRFVDAARSRYRDALIESASEGEPTPDDCVFPFCDTHLRGGIAINSGGGCTAGFVTSAGGAAKWILTAGHCIPGNANWSTVSPTTGTIRQIGPSWNFSFGLSGSPAGIGGDMGIILVSSNTEQVGPWVWSSKQTRHPITWVWSFTFPPLGTYVCKTGRTSAFQCGPVTGVKTVFYKKANQIVVNLVSAAIVSCSGDSGGPIFANHGAFGVTSGGPKANPGDLCGFGVYYQDIKRATASMGVQVLLQ